MHGMTFTSWMTAVCGGLLAVSAAILPFVAWRRGLITSDGRRIWPRSSPEEFILYVTMFTLGLAILASLLMIDSPWKTPAVLWFATIQTYFRTMYRRRHPWKQADGAREDDIFTNGSMTPTICLASMAVLGTLIEAVDALL